MSEPVNKFEKVKRMQPVNQIKDECIMLFNDSTNMKQFWAHGKVYKIERGENFDLVNVKCGFNARVREIIVTDNHARRQILTLKRGQYGTFYGQCRIYIVELENGKKVPKWHFFAYDIMGSYVPTMFDVKKREKNIETGEEVNYIDNLMESKVEYFDGVLNQIFGKEKKGVDND